MLSRLEDHLMGIAAKQDSTSSEISAMRETVSNQCAESGMRECGIYQLCVPTGGGKTLSSLRFALVHAKNHSMRRIIYVIPYLSILDQTAMAIRDAIGGDDQIVLEHHSNILPDDPVFYKLHTDRWDSHIILTTQVQFLESVFSAKGSDLRKLHNMANSVIIFDEAQSLPIKCVHLFNSAVNFLNAVCKVTILLCSATQPLLDKVERKILLSANPSIAADCVSPKRTNIEIALRAAGYSFQDLAEFAFEKLESSMLIIVNTKAAAKSLFTELDKAGVSVMHLSTSMCPAHRDAVIADLKSRLNSSLSHNSEDCEPFICVSTQLVEAGLDISFECVIRDISGLDSIFQAAGRCNRHGEFGCIKNVYVVNIKGVNLSKLPDIQIGADITYRLFKDEAIDINKYYEKYFHARRRQMDYPIDDGSTYDLLTKNIQGFNALKNKGHAHNVEMRPAIRSAAENFYVIAPGQTEVLVPYGECKRVVAEYIATHNLAGKREKLRELNKYAVSLYSYQVEQLKEKGALPRINEDEHKLLILADGFYNSHFGVDIDGSHDFLYV